MVAPELTESKSEGVLHGTRGLIPGRRDRQADRVPRLLHPLVRIPGRLRGHVVRLSDLLGGGPTRDRLHDPGSSVAATGSRSLRQRRHPPYPSGFPTRHRSSSASRRPDSSSTTRYETNRGVRGDSDSKTRRASGWTWWSRSIPSRVIGIRTPDRLRPPRPSDRACARTRAPCRRPHASRRRSSARGRGSRP